MISIITNNRFLLHDSGFGHPERSERIIACVNVLKSSDISSRLSWIIPRSAEISDIQRVHSSQYIQKVKETCELGGGYLDQDTYAGKDSYEIALLSSGAWLVGVDEVLVDQSAFVISRPPGHHAEYNKAMGFCLFNNCAVATSYAIEEKNIDRVAIFDWDVHHGNGTQQILENEKRVRYCSIHQSPHYPGTGTTNETGKYNNILNIPLPAGTGSEEYLSAFFDKVIPFLCDFNPQLIIVSAGFDAHKDDPLSEFKLKTEDFGEMAKALLSINPHILFGLEGGYDLTALAESVLEVCKAVV